MLITINWGPSKSIFKIYIFKIGRLLIFTEELKEKINISSNHVRHRIIVMIRIATYLIYECNGTALGDAKFDGSCSGLRLGNFFGSQIHDSI